MQSCLDDYLDFNTFLARYPQFKIGQLRWMVVKKEKYGLTNAFRQIGRRIYIHVPTFTEWVKTQYVNNPPCSESGHGDNL